MTSPQKRRQSELEKLAHRRRPPIRRMGPMRRSKFSDPRTLDDGARKCPEYDRFSPRAHSPGSSAEKSGEVRLLHLLLRRRPGRPSAARDVIDRIHLLHVLGNDVREAQRGQARLR